MIDLALKLLVVVAGMVILWRAEPAISHMSRRTPFLVRWSFLLLAVGALALLFHALAGQVPSPATVLLSVGVAALLVCERRVRYLASRPRRIESKGSTPCP